MLKNCSHNSFPIVNGAEMSKMVIEGSISRTILMKMLEHRLGLYNDRGATAVEGEAERATTGAHEDLQDAYTLPRDQRRRRHIQHDMLTAAHVQGSIQG